MMRRDLLRIFIGVISLFTTVLASNPHSHDLLHVRQDAGATPTGQDCQAPGDQHFCAPPDWTQLYKDKQCPTQPKFKEPVHSSTNREPNSDSECENPDDRGLKRSRLVRRGGDDQRNILQEGLFGESSHALEIRDDTTALVKGKVCNWVWLGLVNNAMGNACESFEMLVEAGKDVLLSWIFEFAVTKIVMWRSDGQGGPMKCAGFYLPTMDRALGKSDLTIPGFKKEDYYHFQFIFEESAKLTWGRVAAWKRAHLG